MNTAESVFAAMHRLQRNGKPCALVSVVSVLAPTSARPGDKAIVTPEGEFHGWIGGGCAQPAVLRTVREALADGRARLIRIVPSDTTEERDLGDVLEFGMSCHSGGTLELFVDPLLPRAELVVIGASPVAHSLVGLAPHVGFSVTQIAHGAEAASCPGVERVIASDDPAVVARQVAPGAWVVVATQGRRDLQALRLALQLQARQISFIASERKARILKESLVTAGADVQATAAIVAPAGYPMAATTPEEIALSVLAAVVSNRRSAVATGAVEPAVDPVFDPVFDPVIGPVVGPVVGPAVATAGGKAGCCSRSGPESASGSASACESAPDSGKAAAVETPEVWPVIHPGPCCGGR